MAGGGQHTVALSSQRVPPLQQDPMHHLAALPEGVSELYGGHTLRAQQAREPVLVGYLETQPHSLLTYQYRAIMNLEWEIM